jgi:hypothetical protein
MGRRKKIMDSEVEGGKINLGKEFKKIGRTLNKKVFKPAERGFQTAGKTLGRFTQKELLPAVKTIGIPMASGVAGAVGTMYGGPIGGVMASQLTSGLLNQYVPNQSKNPYVGLAGDALSMGMFGGDPLEQMQLMGKMNKQISKDIIGSDKPKGFVYNPDNPYEDLITQMMSKYQQPVQALPLPQPITKEQPEDLRDDFDAMYEESQLGKDADSMIVVKPPFQQREGSVQGLLGAGIKKKRGRPKKKKDVEGIVKVEVIKSLPYKKFSGAKNSALDQLLEAKAEKEEKQAKKAMKEMVESQSKMLKALGYGLKKGSKEAKERMAKIRAMRGKK